MSERSRAVRLGRVQPDRGKGEKTTATWTHRKGEGSSGELGENLDEEARVNDSLALLESALPTTTVPRSWPRVLTDAQHLAYQLHGHLTNLFARYRTLHGHAIYNSATFTLSHARSAFVRFLAHTENTIRDRNEMEEYLEQHVTEASTKFFTSLLQSSAQIHHSPQGPSLTPLPPPQPHILPTLEQDMVKTDVPTTPTCKNSNSDMNVIETGPTPHSPQVEGQQTLHYTPSQKKKWNSPNPYTPVTALKPRKGRRATTPTSTPVLDTTTSKAAHTSRKAHSPAGKKRLNFAELPSSTLWDGEPELFDSSDKENQPIKKPRLKFVSSRSNSMYVNQQGRNPIACEWNRKLPFGKHSKLSPYSVASAALSNPYTSEPLSHNTDLSAQGKYGHKTDKKSAGERGKFITSEVNRKTSELSKPIMAEKSIDRNKRKRDINNGTVLNKDECMVSKKLKQLQLEKDCSSYYPNNPVPTSPWDKNIRSFCIEQQGTFNSISENGVKKKSPIKCTSNLEHCTPPKGINTCLPFSSPSSFMVSFSSQTSSSSEDYLPLSSEDVLLTTKFDKTSIFTPLQLDIIDSAEIDRNNEWLSELESSGILKDEKALQICTHAPYATQSSSNLGDVLLESMSTASPLHQSCRQRKSCINFDIPFELNAMQSSTPTPSAPNGPTGDKHSQLQTPQMNPEWIKAGATPPTSSGQPPAALPQRELTSPQAVTPMYKHPVAESLPGPSRLLDLESFTTPEGRPYVYPLCAPKKFRRPTPKQHPPQCRRSLVREFTTRANEILPLLDTPPSSPVGANFSLLEMESDDD